MLDKFGCKFVGAPKGLDERCHGHLPDSSRFIGEYATEIVMAKNAFVLQTALIYSSYLIEI